MNEAQARRIARNKLSTGKELMQLVDISEDIDLLLAKHQNTSARTLETLLETYSFDERFMGVAVAHPNIDVEELINVGDEYPLAMFRNPALPALIKKRKTFLDQFGGDAFEKALKSKNVPECVIDWLATRGTQEYQLLFIQAPHRDTFQIERFRESKHPRVVATLVDRDVKTYLIWARDMGLDVVAADQLASPELRSRIDAWIGWLAGKAQGAPLGVKVSKGKAATLPKVLQSALIKIEEQFFKDGRVALSVNPKLFDELAALMQKTLKENAGSSNLIKRVTEFDLAELKRFANPAKRPAGKNGLSTYYVRSGMEKSFQRLMAALALWSRSKSETDCDKLAKSLEKLAARHSLTVAQGHAKKEIKQSQSDEREAKSDETVYLAWAQDLGFVAPEPHGDEAIDLNWAIDVWVDDLSIENLPRWKALVPAKGCASTLQGELVRAIDRISSEYFRNGMMNWGDGSGYYEKLVKLIHTTLKAEKSFSKQVQRVLDTDIAEIRRSGEAGKAMADGKKTPRDVFGSNFLLQGDVERSHKRLDALISIWCGRHKTPVPYKEAV